MADIVSNAAKMNDLEISADAPITEDLFEKIGANINYLLDLAALGVTTYLVNGSYTVAEGQNRILVKMCGGGGGGGAGGANGPAGGGAGGAGGSVLETMLNVTPLDVHAVTIGIGGVGAGANGGTGTGGTGSAGTDTTFGIIATAKGGAPGTGGQGRRPRRRPRSGRGCRPPRSSLRRRAPCPGKARGW